MKKVLKPIIGSLLLVVLTISFYSFKKYQDVKSKANVLRNFLYDGLFGSEYIEGGKLWMIDSTMYVEWPVSWNKDRRYYFSPKTFCGNSPAHLTEALFEAVSIKDSAGDYLDANTSFKQIFGKDVRKTSHKDRTHINNASYNAGALLAAFNELYKKPNESIDGMVMGKIYNIAFRDYARACTYIMVDVMKNKKAFEQQAKIYKDTALSGKLEDGQTFCFGACNKILGKDYGDKLKPFVKNCINYGRHDRIVGIMLRRQIDGSLPTILSCVKRMLKDYDPTFYETVKTKF